MDKQFETLLNALQSCPIVPVLTIDDSEIAAPLARALHAAGLTVIEITLRTPQALGAIKKMKQAAPSLLVGAGTILTPNDVQASVDAGSDFLVTPAVSSQLLPAVKATRLPVFPGVATPSEALEMYTQGFSHVKFFPAEASGGVRALKAIAAPLPHITFMPTGGINGTNAPDYLALSNVIAVGGSWMIDKHALALRDFKRIQDTARQAVTQLG